jgi:hypothetical protein
MPISVAMDVVEHVSHGTISVSLSYVGTRASNIISHLRRARFGCSTKGRRTYRDGELPPPGKMSFRASIAWLAIVTLTRTSGSTPLVPPRPTT